MVLLLPFPDATIICVRRCLQDTNTRMQGATFYGLDGLKLQCEIALCKKLHPDHVATLLVLVDQTAADMLKEECMNYIAQNATDVMASAGWNHYVTNQPRGSAIMSEVMGVMAKCMPSMQSTALRRKKRSAEKAGLSAHGAINMAAREDPEVAAVDDEAIKAILCELQRKKLSCIGDGLWSWRG